MKNNHPNRKPKKRAPPRPAPRTDRRTTRTAPQPSPRHDHDAAYASLLERLRLSLGLTLNRSDALFTTDATGLFDAYIRNLPADQGIHDCSACRRFIEAYGGLVMIGEDGDTIPIMVIGECPSFYETSFRAIYAVVKRAKVTGVFLSSEKIWGTPVTGPWTHFSAVPPVARVFKERALTAGQARAAKREDFRTVAAALPDFSPHVLSEAMRLLEADALARSEKFIAPIQWLQDLHEKRGATKNARTRDNLLWRAIASAPDGFCHPRSSVTGSLLEDIAAGMAFDDVKARFDAKMHPLRYQRPQAAPSAGTLAQAEKLVAQLGIAGSLDRRFARLDECVLIWKPTPPKVGAGSDGAVFGHIQAKGLAEPVALDLPTQTMTWVKFARMVLPDAEKLELHVPARGNFMGYLTAQNADAPPILKWDSEDKRNAVSYYVYHNGSDARGWNLTAGTYAEISGVSPFPQMWGETPMPHLGDGILLALRGAVDTRSGQGNALFPENLRAELHGVRAVIEAYSKAATIVGAIEASACGMCISKGEGGKDHRIRVTSRGKTSLYKIDRWD